MVVWFSVLLEYLIFKITARPYPSFDALTSIFLEHVRELFIKGIVFLGFVDISFLAYKWRVGSITVDDPWNYVLVFFGLDFAYYWMHRAGHQIRLFWISHAIHHLPNQLMYVRSLQQSFSGVLFSSTHLICVPAAFFGLHPKVTFSMLLLNMIFQHLLHTELIPRLGVIEYVFNTPCKHRIHHSTLEAHVNKNFCGVFCIWDQLFGTFHLDERRPESYGLSSRVENQRLTTPIEYEYQQWKILLLELVSGKGLRARALSLLHQPMPGQKSYDYTITIQERILK